MVTIKRYIGRFRKPLFWRGRGVAVRSVILPLVVAGGLLWLVRTYVATPYAVTDARPDMGLLAGDRILALPSYRRQTPLHGDAIVYHPSTDRRRLAIGRVTAIGGDTIDYPVAGRLRESHLRVDSLVIPRQHIVGRITLVAYSVIPEAPLYHCLRPHRFFVTP
jgi:signal peptidase I